MEDRLRLMLEMQRELQLKMPPPNRVPADLEGDERAAFMVWNAYACTDELHEALGEMGWKPWATSRHFNSIAMLKEMVDAWHFFMNMLLVIAGDLSWTTDELADEFCKAYINKNLVNAERQKVGYDGVSSKCGNCHRELSEVDQDMRVSVTYQTLQDESVVMEFCSTDCQWDYEEKLDA